jgi:hypothetical protein
VRAITGIAGAQRGHVRFDGRLLNAAPAHQLNSPASVRVRVQVRTLQVRAQVQRQV